MPSEIVGLQRARSLVLRVPSAVIPSAGNYLINPEHAQFKSAVIDPPEPFAFDPRLLGKTAARRSSPR